MNVRLGDDNAMRAAKDALNHIIAKQRTTATNGDLAGLYARAVTAYSAANFWAGAMAGVKFRVLMHGDGVADSHPLTALMNNMSAVLYRLEITRAFWGRWLLVKERDLYGRTIGLRWLNPLLWSPDVNMDALQGFRVSRNRGNGDLLTYYKPQDVVWWHGVDLEDDFDGVAPAEAAFLQGSAQVEASETALWYFRNRAIPAALLMPADNEAEPTPQDVDEMRNLWRRLVKGARNAGRTIVESKRWQLVTFQPDYEKLTMSAVYADTRAAVCEAFGIPEAFLTSNVSSYAEFEGQMRNWYQTTFLGQVTQYAEAFTQQLAAEYGPDLRIVADISHYMPEDEQKRLDVVNTKLNARLFTIGQAQEALGQPVDSVLADCYLIDGVPVPRAEMRNYWRYKLGGMVPEPATPPPTSGGITVETPPASEEPAMPLQPEPLVLPAPTVTLEGDPVTPTTTLMLAPPTQRAAIADDVWNELQTWQRVVVRRGADYAFTAEHVPDEVQQFIRWGLEGDRDLPEVFDAARALLRDEEHEAVMAYRAYQRLTLNGTAKSVQATRLQFEDQFTTLLNDARERSKITRGRFVTTLGFIVRMNGQQAYLDGLAENGVPDPVLDEDDRTKLNNLLAEQAQYIRSLGEVLYANENTVSDAMADQKPAMWWNKSLQPFYDAGRLSAQSNQMMEWVLGPTEERCSDCLRFSGQRHRLRLWHKDGWIPKADKLECGGFNCKCTLVPSTGRARGRLPGKVKK